MLDINLFREEKLNKKEDVIKSQKKRFADEGLVDKVCELDKQWRAARYEVDRLNTEANALNKQIGALRKAKQDATELQERSKSLKAGAKQTEERLKELEATRDAALVQVGNLVHESVPVSDDEANNVVVKTWGERRQQGDGVTAPKLYNHVDLVLMLDLVDFTAGSSVAGSRGYYLKGELAMLNQALIAYAQTFMFGKGYTPVYTPFFMTQEAMGKVAQLSQFDDELYKVTGEGDDKYLIATSEQTLCALHRNGWFEQAELPVKYAGFSTCFRKEVGSHGRDTLGIFRVHQFEKVEQFVICSPADGQSWALMEEMLGNAEAFYQTLGLPYQVVNIVSGELNNAAAKKYDLEAWFPASSTLRELVSCSNCTDYQSRRLDIRVRTPKTQVGAAAAGAAGGGGVDKGSEFVHLLNSTLTATSRTLCCLLENWQTPDGVTIPEPLRPFIMGMDFIPFKKKYDAKGKLADLSKQRPAPAAAAITPTASADGGAAMSTS